MSNLDDLIDRTHFDYEQNETKAKQLEDRILKVPGMSKSYLPKRKYGENYKGDQLGVTASSLIVKGDKALAAFLGLDLNYWKEKAKAEKSISKIELLNATSPLSNIIVLFLIDELLEEISLEKDFVSRS